jgi:hypothetical protein
MILIKWRGQWLVLGKNTAMRMLLDKSAKKDRK